MEAQLELESILLPGVDSKRPLVIAGPCSAETEEQVMNTARELAASGIKIFRAGIWKPRTRPGSFEGVGSVGLPWLQRVKRETGMYTAVEVADDGEAELGVGLELEGTGLVEVVVGIVVRRSVGAGADGANGEGAHGVGAAAIELLGVGHLAGIAVGMGGADEAAHDEPGVAGAGAVAVDELGLAFDELGEGRAEEFLVAVFAAQLVDAPEDVAGFLDGEGEVDAVVASILSVKDIGVLGLGYELAHERLGDGGVGGHDGVDEVLSEGVVESESEPGPGVGPWVEGEGADEGVGREGTYVVEVRLILVGEFEFLREAFDSDVEELYGVSVLLHSCSRQKLIIVL